MTQAPETLFGSDAPKRQRATGPALHEIHVYHDKGRADRFGAKWWNGKDWKGAVGDADCAIGAAHGAAVVALANVNGRIA